MFAFPALAAGGWQRQPSGVLAWLRAVYFVDAERGWAVGSKGVLLATLNGGRTWDVRRRPTEDSLRDIYFTDARTGWLVCDRSIYLLKTKEEPRSYLLHTTDGGETWARVVVTGADTDVSLTRIVFANERRGWTFGEMGALYATGDGGASWTRLTIPTKHVLLGGALFVNGQGFVVGAGNTLLSTPDGGAEWRAGSAPVSRANAVATMTTPTAGGAAAAMRFNAVAFIDERRGWAVGERGTLLVTLNGGRSWRAQESNVAVDLSDVKFANERTGWAVGTDGTVIHTTDGGATWQVETSGTRHPLERLAVTSDGRAWAVGFGGTIINYNDGDDGAGVPQLKPSAPAAPRERPRRVLKKETAP